MEVDAKWFPEQFLIWLLVILMVKITIFGLCGQYSGWWRYASVSDLFGIIKASYLSSLILVPGWYIFCLIIGKTYPDPNTIPTFLVPLHGIDVSILIIDWAATILIICVARMSIRLYYEENRTISKGRLARMLIVGAGNAGETLLREIQRMSKMQYEVAGFIDDNPKKIGAKIHGTTVLGNTSQIRDIAAKEKIDEIVIAMPSASHKQIRKVIEYCRGANLKFSIVPDLVSIATGQVSVSQMREVDINDLLGRDPVTLDMESIRQFLNNKVILITGAGGSIGSEMCRQVASFGPKLLILVEKVENPLFFIDRELRNKFSDLECRPHICDIADAQRVDHLFSKYKPEVVIHAAAHKHVPLMENDPGEAIKNNVVGTRTIAYASDKHGVDHFVMISTDKAVNPTSIMGSSKRLAEMSIQCLSKRSKTVFSTVRFGNVLGSNGSVIPIFREQIRRGGPVTVTHPDMCRYFMTIPEASQLVLQAATMGSGGEIFVLDMGEPVKIVDLARDLITLSGFRPNEDIEINFSGMRPGEKLFEELSIEGEDMAPTPHSKIGIWHNVPADENILDSVVGELVDVANDNNYQQIVALIKEVIPEYVGDVDSMKLHEAHLEKCKNSDTAFNRPSVN
ncbi:MAG: polysaccharide biosynthesis protein [Phycisphaerae bacterium]|nr:polysaccharide biosynthesis protein [Phycisphaerae bacterium]